MFTVMFVAVHLSTNFVLQMAVEHLAVVEVQVCHPVVRDGTTILVVPNLDYAQPDEKASLSHMLQCDSVLPLLVYAMDQPSLRQKV